MGYRLKILQEPVEVTVSLMPGGYFPNCINPEYRPFKELIFKATAKAVWCNLDGENEFVSIVVEGKTYMVRFNDLTTLSIMSLNRKAYALPHEKSLEDIRQRYTLEALATDLCLMRNQWDVTIVSVDGVDVTADLKWQLNGHVKPVTGAKMMIVFDKIKHDIRLLP